jgi:N6-adenosine-specific RNA methylase IME4
MFVYIVVYASKVLRQKNVTLEKTEQKKIYVMSVLNMIPFPDKKYNIIYADPPWSYGDKVLNHGHGKRFDPLSNHYSSMSKKELLDLPVRGISDVDCVLFLWSTDSHIPEAIELIKQWGFTYKTVGFYWLKLSRNTLLPQTNLGKWTQKNIEICLLATKGKMSKYLEDRTIHQLVEAPRNKHSKKPLEVKDKIVKMFGDLPRIELFARQKTGGWDVWGDSENLK